VATVVASEVVAITEAASAATMADPGVIAEAADIAVMAASVARREASAAAPSAARADIPGWDGVSPVEEHGWAIEPQPMPVSLTAGGMVLEAEQASEPGAPHLPVDGAEVSVSAAVLAGSAVVGVIPAGAGAAGVSASVGAGVGGWAGGVPVGDWAGVLSGIGRRIGITPGDHGATAIRDMFMTIPTEPTLPVL
jgi:hypothetical protein